MLLKRGRVESKQKKGSGGTVETSSAAVINFYNKICVTLLALE